MAKVSHTVGVTSFRLMHAEVSNWPSTRAGRVIAIARDITRK